MDQTWSQRLRIPEKKEIASEAANDEPIQEPVNAEQEDEQQAGNTLDTDDDNEVDEEHADAAAARDDIDDPNNEADGIAVRIIAILIVCPTLCNSSLI